jgi:UDP-glucose:glycoprotein glucosyltransferase
MANVGYLQFKVTPGVYDLSIRPGRGRDVFELESTGTTGWDSKAINETGAEVVLASFEGMTILPKFRRQAGMELEDVLLETPSSSTNMAGAVWSRYVKQVCGPLTCRMKELVGLPTSALAPPASKHADINIFTVASGLLYEVRHQIQKFQS